MIDECVECGDPIPPEELVVDEGDRFHRVCFDAMVALARADLWAALAREAQETKT